MADGTPTPAAHDGMAVVAQSGSVLHLVRNHEVTGPGQPIGGGRLPIYDRLGQGGTTTLRFDQEQGEWLDAAASLAGTTINCAGGRTPWRSWLSCEESVAGKEAGFERSHGWVFEVPFSGVSDAQPLQDLGRFVHEAVAVDPRTGFVYETEDHRAQCGLYRFQPNRPGSLGAGGRLQIMKVRQQSGIDLGRGPARLRMGVVWVDIEDSHAVSASTFEQGLAMGAARFHRLEGIWYDHGRIYFTDTEGGDDRATGGSGRVWELDPDSGNLQLLFQSPGRETANQPDNIAISERGGIVLCEDGGGVLEAETGELLHGERLLGLTRQGRVFAFAENAVWLEGGPAARGFTGDFRRREWAGVGFHGEWLFANAQVPGITFAITGPWSRGSL